MKFGKSWTKTSILGLKFKKQQKNEMKQINKNTFEIKSGDVVVWWHSDIHAIRTKRERGDVVEYYSPKIKVRDFVELVKTIIEEAKK